MLGVDFAYPIAAMRRELCNPRLPLAIQRWGHVDVRAPEK